MMKMSSFFYSIVFHFLFLLALLIQFPNNARRNEKPIAAPIIFNLKNVEIGEKTVIPPMKGKNNAPQTAVATPAPAPAAAEVKPASKPSEGAAVVEEKKADAPVVPSVIPKAKPVFKAPPAPAPKSSSTAASSTAATQNNAGMQRLLASVEKMSAGIKTGSVDGAVDAPVTDISADKMTVSEIDYIAQSIRDHWNLDAGMPGLDQMIVEMKVSLSRDGRVMDVSFLNTSKMNNPSYKSVAESARRAVYICDRQGEDSPFKKLAVRNPDAYNSWKEIVFRFSPLEGKNQ